MKGGTMSYGNPLFNEKSYQQALNRVHPSQAMTLQGTINKTFVLLFLCVISAMFAWKNATAWLNYITFLSFGTFIISMIIIFRKTAAPVLAPVFAIGEGLILGAISAKFNASYQGIVGQAITITLLVFGVMLFLYKSGIIKVTRSFVLGITAATGAIALFYLGSFLVGLFGVEVSYFTSTSSLSIAVNVGICLVAAFNFVMDFHFINQLTDQITAPKYMEWYAGFSLMVTLVWLYLEILRLLARTRDR